MFNAVSTQQLCVRPRFHRRDCRRTGPRLFSTLFSASSTDMATATFTQNGGEDPDEARGPAYFAAGANRCASVDNDSASYWSKRWRLSAGGILQFAYWLVGTSVIYRPAVTHCVRYKCVVLSQYHIYKVFSFIFLSSMLYLEFNYIYIYIVYYVFIYYI